MIKADRKAVNAQPSHSLVAAKEAAKPKEKVMVRRAEAEQLQIRNFSARIIGKESAPKAKIASTTITVLARSTKRATVRKARTASSPTTNNKYSQPISSRPKLRARPQKRKLKLRLETKIEVEARAMQSRRWKRLLIIRIRSLSALSIPQRPRLTIERSPQSAYYNLTWNQKFTIFNTFQMNEILPIYIG